VYSCRVRLCLIQYANNNNLPMVATGFNGSREKCSARDCITIYAHIMHIIILTIATIRPTIYYYMIPSHPVPVGRIVLVDVVGHSWLDIRRHRHNIIYAIYHPDRRGGDFHAGKTRNGQQRLLLPLYNNIWYAWNTSRKRQSVV